jgi:hypothetical protein
VSDTEYVVLWKVRITGLHRPTGKTVHYSGGEVVPTPSELQIAQYPGDDGYYLFYLDESGQEMTDTFHDDIRSAMDQADWEFEVKSSEWEKVG